MNTGYRKITKITYNNKDFLVLRNNENKYAFLLINDEGYLKYPDMKDYLELAQIFSTPDHFMEYRSEEDRNKLKFKMKCRINGILLSIGLAIPLVLGAAHFNPEVKKVLDTVVTQDIEDNNEIINIDLDQVNITEEELEKVFEGNVPHNPVSRPQTVESSDSTTIESKKQIIFYEPEALKQYLGTPTVTKENLNKVIDNNSGISSDYKEFIKDYCNTMIDYYPGINMTVFYENLKDLKIRKSTTDHVESDTRESLATYNCEDNTINLSKDFKLQEDTQNAVILRHELTHAMNIYRGEKNGYDITYRFQYKDDYYFTYEALTVILSTAPFEDRYSETTKVNMGYALTSNIMRILLTALPNASIQDLYVCHVSDLANYLDNNINSSYNGKEFLDVLEVVSVAYYNPEIELDKDTVKAVYNYIGDAYTQNIITQETTQDEKQEIYDYIDARLKQGVNSTKYIQMEPFQKRLNINNEIKTK